MPDFVRPLPVSGLPMTRMCAGFPSTLNDLRPPAEICRERGWGVGTRLVGDEGHGPHTIEITAIGEREILAKCIHPCDRREGLWTFRNRDWKEVPADAR